MEDAEHGSVIGQQRDAAVALLELAEAGRGNAEPLCVLQQLLTVRRGGEVGSDHEHGGLRRLRQGKKDVVAVKRIGHLINHGCIGTVQRGTEQLLIVQLEIQKGTQPQIQVVGQRLGKQKLSCLQTEFLQNSFQKHEFRLIKPGRRPKNWILSTKSLGI